MASELQTVSDEKLTRQSQAGSLAAFEELVHRYERRIYGFVAKCCGSASDASEITQDTFVRAFQAIARFDSRQAFAPWLFTIARRKCIDRHRAALRINEEPLPAVPGTDDPSEALAQREERQNLWALARRRLPIAQFQALWLRYAEDMAVAQIAQVLGRTQTHIKVLLFRGRNALGKELQAGLPSRPPAAPITLETIPTSPPGSCFAHHIPRFTHHEILARKA